MVILSNFESLIGEHITNSEVLRPMKNQTKILYQIKERQTWVLGHIMRNSDMGFYSLYSLHGKIQGKGSVGRRRRRRIMVKKF